VVQDKAATVCKRLHAAIKNGEPCDMHHALRAVSIDVISDFAFNRSYDLLKSDDLGARFFELTGGVGPSMWVFQQAPLLREIALKMPPWMASRLDEALGKVHELQAECVRQVEDVRQGIAAGKYSERPTIFSTILSPEDKPEGYHIPSTEELKEEAYSVIMAAADTTGNAMTVALYHTLRNPEIYNAVSQELQDAFPHAGSDEELSFPELEKLPYLVSQLHEAVKMQAIILTHLQTAVIKEGLRLSFGVPGRLPREVPEPGATFNGYFIPPGYVVGMSSWTLHRNKDLFPDPMKFDPGRWMDPDKFRVLDHYLVSFSKGTRGCVGMP
jgi:cytochrome P450